jgi:hypothetical protein
MGQSFAVVALLLAQSAEGMPQQCGMHALRDCLALLGRPESTATLVRSLPRQGENLSLLELADTAQIYGCETLMVRWVGSPTFSKQHPAILPVIKNGANH